MAKKFLRIIIIFIVLFNIVTPIYSKDINIVLQINRTTKANAIKQLGNPDYFSVLNEAEILTWYLWKMKANDNDQITCNIDFYFADGTLIYQKARRSITLMFIYGRLAHIDID